MKRATKLLSSLALSTATALTALIISGCNRCCDYNDSCYPNSYNCAPQCNTGYGCNNYGNGYYRRASHTTDFSSKFQLNRKPTYTYDGNYATDYNQGNGYDYNQGGYGCDTGSCDQSYAPAQDNSCNPCQVGDDRRMDRRDDRRFDRRDDRRDDRRMDRRDQDYSCAPVCAPVKNDCAPVCAPVNQPVNNCAPVGDAVATIKNDQVVITKRYPSKIDLGTEYMVELQVKAIDNASNVVITETLPKAATFVRSEPSANNNGGNVSWTVDNLHKGSVKTIRFWLRADCEGELCGCTTVTCCPMICVGTFVGKACLVCKKTGPDRVNCDDNVEFQIHVQNVGTAVAKNVLVTENLPAEVQHASGQRVLRFPLGDLQPKECREIRVNVKALTRCIRVCNKITTTSANCEATGCECCLDICKSIVSIQKTGPCEQYICKVAPYEITIRNEGDNVLHNVVVTDIAPAGTTIVKAPGASINCNRAVWTVPCFNPGETKSFCLNLTTQTCGTYCNRATVKASDGCGNETQLCTNWKGCAGITACISDCKDPLCLGETNTYKISVRNQGTAADKNVSVNVIFDDKIQPISGSGASPATVCGRTVSFRPIPCVGPKQSLEFIVKAKSVAPGDSRVKAEIKSDALDTPVTEEESTHVY